MLEKIRFYMMLVLAGCGVLFLLMIVIAVRKHKKFKAYLAEPLTNHLQDDLHASQYEDWRVKKPSVYLYGQIAKYAENVAFESIPKRKRYDSEGQYTPLSQQKIAQQMQAIGVMLLRGESFLGDGYCSFISEYRPYYTVKDFYKSIPEYFAFCQNPNLFEKPKSPEEAKPEPEEDTSGFYKDEPVSPAEQNDSVSVQEEPVPEEDDYSDIRQQWTNVIHFSCNMTVDHMVMDALQTYVRKLAAKKCSAAGQAITDADGSDTDAYQQMCRTTYNSMNSLFFERLYFKKEFVDWVTKEHPDMDDISRFYDLIPMYIRHLKQKS